MDKNTIIGVAGAGTMGTGIAQIVATRGHKVLLYDTDSSQLENSRHNLKKILDRQVEKERMTRQEVEKTLNNIEYVDHTTDFKRCGLAIEAIIENLEIKRDFFGRIEGIVPRDCLLGTNTSSLSIASISAGLKKPDRFLGIHFFNPAPLMKLVELIPGLDTTDKIMAASRNLITQWGKISVTSKDTPGFIVNRVARPFYGEALRMYEEGIADFPTIDWAMKKLGEFKMGPFELMDLIGNDVNYKVTETIFREFYFDPRFKPSYTQKRMIDAGHLGRKTGRGFYNYADESKNPKPVEDQYLGEKILNRMLSMLINEACDAVFMQIASLEDVDHAMKNGVNYPKGLLEWGDEIGLNNVLDQMTALQVEYREDRYRPNPLLKRMVREERTFYGD